MFIYIAIAVLVLLLISYPVIGYILRKINLQEKDEIYFEEKRSKGSHLYAYYDFFSHWILTEHYIFKLKKQLDVYFPAQEKEAAEQTMKMAFANWGVGLVVILIVLYVSPKLITAIILFSGVYFFSAIKLHRMIANMDLNLLEDNMCYLSDVRHTYQSQKVIEDTLEMAIHEKTPSTMKGHGMYIREVIMADDMDEKIKDYMDNVPNRFLKELMALCVTVMQFGDHMLEGQPAFLTSLRNLKIKINMERLRLKKQEHLFAGYLIIIACPIFFLPVIHNWALSTFPSTSWFYEGTPGIIYSVIAFLVTIICFNLTMQLQESYRVKERDYLLLFRLCEVPLISKIIRSMQSKNAGKKERIEQLIRETGDTITSQAFLLKQILFAIIGLLLANLIVVGVHWNTRINCLNANVEFTNLSSAVTEEEQVMLQEEVTELLKKYAGKEVSVETIEQEINHSNLSKDYLKEIAFDEAVERINQYNNAYYKWYELLLTLFASTVCFYYPYWMLLYQKVMVKTIMLDEVMQFQSVIYMLSPIPQMTPEIILGWLEHFAVIFRGSISKCLDNFVAAEVEALEELEETESYEPFRRLIENLQACDKCGVQEAFDELGSEQNYYLEERKQEGEMALDDNSAIANTLAILPTFFVAVGYLFLPIIIESFMQFIRQSTSIFN